jgi:hypothetical protein
VESKASGPTDPMRFGKNAKDEFLKAEPVQSAHTNRRF